MEVVAKTGMKRVAFLSIVAVALFSACQARKEVSQIWDYVNERPDSALAVLNGMDASAFHGRTLAEYRLLKAMALDKNYVNVASDSLAMPAYQFFRRYGPKEKEMLSLYYLAISHYYADNYPEVILLLEEETNMADAQGDYLYLGLGHIVKSYAFLGTYSASEAVKSAELGVAAFEAIQDSFQVQRAKLQLADSYHATKDYAKALGIYQELIQTCQKDTITMCRALIHGAYSLYLANPEQADSALHYYERALADYGASMSPVEAAHLGLVAAKAGNTELAHQVTEQLKVSGKYPEQRAYLEYKLFVDENKPWEALDAIEEYNNLQDSIVRETLEQSLIKTQRNYQEQQKQSAEHALYLSKWIGSVSVLCLLLALLSLWLYYSRKHKIASLEREQLIGSVGEMAKLLQESEQANSDLKQDLETAQKRYVAAYKKQFSKISSIIENYYTSSGMKNGRDIVYRQVMDIAGTIGQDQTRMSVLEKDVNAALDNAMKWYRLEFPEKGIDHYRMVCLFMAGFTVPMIEILTGVTKNTLYSRKSRLLEQIRSSDAEHKDLFLMAIQ